MRAPPAPPRKRTGTATSSSDSHRHNPQDHDAPAMPGRRAFWPSRLSCIKRTSRLRHADEASCARGQASSASAATPHSPSAACPPASTASASWLSKPARSPPLTPSSSPAADSPPPTPATQSAARSASSKPFIGGAPKLGRCARWSSLRVDCALRRRRYCAGVASVRCGRRHRRRTRPPRSTLPRALSTARAARRGAALQHLSCRARGRAATA